MIGTQRTGWIASGRSAAGVTAVLLLAAFAVVGCEPRHPKNEAHSAGEEPGHDEGDGHAEGAPRGPHGGKLLGEDSPRLELRIVEDGVPPRYRAWLIEAGNRAMNPVAGELTAVLTRFGGRVQTLSFRHEGDHFMSNEVVGEPHSFAAQFQWTGPAGNREWSFAQEEGRVELVADAVTAGKIESAPAGPRDIRVVIETPGEVRLNAESVIQIRPRFPGVIRQLARRLGDEVVTGDVLAVVQSNESLTEYSITASMPGSVVSRQASLGQSVDHQDVIYTIADLTDVWVDFALYPQDAPRVRVGQLARVRSQGDASQTARGPVRYVGPLLEQDTRVSHGRIVLSNRDGRWPPGMFVSVGIEVDQARVAVAVPEEAIVRTERGPAVFRAEGNTFELQPVTPGRSDGTWTEIVEGLEPGARVVVRNAFLLKSELGKSEATHDH